MLISTKQKNNILKSKNEALVLNIHNNKLDVVQKTKYLGVQIDSSLDWSEQIKVVSTKVSRAVGFPRHAKSFLPKESSLTLYTGIVEPHLRYCCSVWNCAGSTEINRLQKLQNRAARLITNNSFDPPSRPLIEGLRWKTIDELISYESKIMVFKSLNELAPQYLCNLFTRNSQCCSRSLRNTETDLKLPKKSQHMARNVSLSVQLSFGIAFQLSQKRHPPLVVLKILSRVELFFYCKYCIIKL